jgi:hypothetical protein
VTLLNLDDVPREWCSVTVIKGRREAPCSRKPTVKEWTEVLVRNDQTDLVIYPVCLYHYNRHLEHGVVNQLGRLL